MTEPSHLSRRGTFAALAVAAAAAGVAVPAAAATAQTPEEEANADMVHKFFKAWGGAAPDAVKLGEYVAESCFVTLNPGPPTPLTTRAVIVEVFKPFLKDGTSFDIEIHATTVQGPAVFVTRTDYVVKNGKRTAEPGIPAVGLFVVKGGKIAFWHDYAFAKA